MKSQKAASDRLSKHLWSDDRPATTVLRAQAYLKRFPDAPDAWTVWARLGDLLTSMARYTDGAMAFSRAMRLLKRAPSRARTRITCVWIGQSWQQRGEFARAEDWFRRAIAADPGNAAGHIYLGGLLALMGRFDEAKQSHRRATRRKKGCPEEGWYNLGLIYRAEQKWGLAVRSFDKAIRIDPEYALAKRALTDVRTAERLARATARWKPQKLREHVAKR